MEQENQKTHVCGVHEQLGPLNQHLGIIRIACGLRQDEHAWKPPYYLS